MDSTTVVLPKHHGRVDALGNVLIYPDGFKAPQAKSRASVKAKSGVEKTIKRAVKRKTSKSPS